jgi:L-lactate dehydrogenase (cytochrome)
MSKKLEQCFNIDDLRKLAKNCLPAPIYEYLRGGADDDWSPLYLRPCGRR